MKKRSKADIGMIFVATCSCFLVVTVFATELWEAPVSVMAVPLDRYGHLTAGELDLSGPAEQPKLLWESYHRVGGNFILYDGAIIARGADTLWCINADNGDPVWSIPINHYRFCGPVVRDDTVYTARRTLGANGNTIFQLLDLDTGDKLREWTLSRKEIVSFLLMDSLLVAVFEHGSVGALSLNSPGDSLLWETDLSHFDFPLSARTGELLLIALGQSYHYDELVAVDIFDGEISWRREFDEFSHYSPSVVNGLLLLRHPDRLRAVRPENGSTAWVAEDTLDSNPAYLDGTICYVAGGRIVKVDANTGNRIESVLLPGRCRRGGRVMIAEDGLYLICRGILKLSHSFELEWFYGMSNAGRPLVLSGKVYGGSGNRFYCLGN